MLKVSSLLVSLLLCFSAFSQNARRETMLKARQLLEKYNWEEVEKLAFTFAGNGDAEAEP